MNLAKCHMLISLKPAYVMMWVHDFMLCCFSMLSLFCLESSVYLAMHSSSSTKLLHCCDYGPWLTYKVRSDHYTRCLPEWYRLVSIINIKSISSTAIITNLGTWVWKSCETCKSEFEKPLELQFCLPQLALMAPNVLEIITLSSIPNLPLYGE